MDNALLQQLKDIHMPPPITWWPLAPGWYLVMLLFLTSLCVVGFFLWRYHLKKKQRRLIMREFSDIEQKLLTGDPSAMAACSVFLRKVALLHFPRHQVAGLEGEAWLTFLDNTGNTNEFTQGIGRLLITAPYQVDCKEDTKPLVALIKRWIQSCLK